MKSHKSRTYFRSSFIHIFIRRSFDICSTWTNQRNCAHTYREKHTYTLRRYLSYTSVNIILCIYHSQHVLYYINMGSITFFYNDKFILHLNLYIASKIVQPADIFLTNYLSIQYVTYFSILYNNTAFVKRLSTFKYHDDNFIDIHLLLL